MSKSEDSSKSDFSLGLPTDAVDLEGYKSILRFRDLDDYADKVIKEETKNPDFSWEGTPSINKRSVIRILRKRHLLQQNAVAEEEAFEDVNQHEQTRHLFIEKFEELAKKDDIIKSKEEIIAKIEEESAEIQQRLKEEIKELRTYLDRFLPHKRAFRNSVYCLTFFLMSLLANLLFNILIITPFFAWLGTVISFGFLVMSYFMAEDWKNHNDNETAG